MGYWKREVLWPKLAGQQNFQSRERLRRKAARKRLLRTQSRKRAALSRGKDSLLAVQPKACKPRPAARRNKPRAAKIRGEASRKVYCKLVKDFLDGEAEEVAEGEETPSGSEEGEDELGEDLLREDIAFAGWNGQRQERLREFVRQQRNGSVRRDRVGDNMARDDGARQDGEASDDGSGEHGLSADEDGADVDAFGMDNADVDMMENGDWPREGPARRDGGEAEDSSQGLLLYPDAPQWCPPDSDAPPRDEPLEAQSPSRALIPGLPDDVALQCLARLPYKQRMVAKAVSSQWNAALSNPFFYRMSSTCSLLQDYLCICQLARPVTSTLLSLIVRLYNPSTRLWLTLPPLRLWDGPGVLAEFECVAVGARLFIIGGTSHLGLWDEESEDSEQLSTVSVFNVLKGRWEVGPRMNAPRSEFVAGAIGERIYVMDGVDASPPEMLNLAAHSSSWQLMEDYQVHADQEVAGSFVRDGKFYILRGGKPHLCVLADIYDPGTNRWQTVQRLCGPEDTVLRSCGRSFATVEDRIYGLFTPSEESEFGTDRFVRCWDGETNTWRTVATYSAAKEYEQLEVLNTVQLVGVGKRLFVIASGNSTHDGGSISFMSVLDLRDTKGAAAGWEVESMQIKTALGEPSKIFGATAMTI